MKERKKIDVIGLYVFLILLILVVSFFALISISMLTIEYPYERGSHWVCEDPEFSLSYSRSAKNDLISEEVLILNGEEIPVWIGYGRGDYAIFPKYSNHYNDRLLTGTWKYRRGELVLQIEEDFILGNKYNELVFSRTD